MEQIFQLKKYQQAMQHIGMLSDALFSARAELEMALLRIKELEEREKKDGEQHSTVEG